MCRWVGGGRCLAWGMPPDGAESSVPGLRGLKISYLVTKYYCLIAQGWQQKSPLQTSMPIKGNF